MIVQLSTINKQLKRVGLVLIVNVWDGQGKQEPTTFRLARKSTGDKLFGEAS